MVAAGRHTAMGCWASLRAAVHRQMGRNGPGDRFCGAGSEASHVVPDLSAAAALPGLRGAGSQQPLRWLALACELLFDEVHPVGASLLSAGADLAAQVGPAYGHGRAVQHHMVQRQWQGLRASALPFGRRYPSSHGLPAGNRAGRREAAQVAVQPFVSVPWHSA